ncbi:MAG: 6-hydroxymethylpterin diphosphokinase MptE-like protein, partial [Paraglaciecola sp.]|uniref:motility associated factor glycosyltransferase family protein n=1 Tax=Paraglaciecola sp. TaxID=1920173 RepID=UPI003297CF66
AEEEVGALPDKIASIIMFGLGAGYQLEKLLDEHIVEKLFICEPNPDFFYGSLFAIDWQEIFETVEKSESRIYLNIGDDGTNLFRDLLNQFYSIGPYILSSTYFYQSYHNASLNSAISQLREQLQVVISMGEYFDHAYYGIAHTKEGMKRKTPILTANPADKLSYDDKEVPIFIVGNGPSLDSSIEAIKEWQGQSIVVSCGTALQALHRQNITPDFHAEIEQNRSTFDWAVLVGDLEYLKDITLLSCNGIHPDTCELYKDVMVAIKEGESSTVSALTVLGRENYEVLQNAFPTVSNFVCDLFSCMGFTSIYLIGVDLGFVSVKHHHSKSSGYYQEDGQETYDYSEKNNTSLIVPGNFRPTVNTKHEFKVSRQVIEQVTAAKPKAQSFYNCSDGAKIQGTLPIRPDDLLIVATFEQKQRTLDVLKTTVFSSNGLENYSEKFERQFSQELLLQEISAFDTLLEKEITCAEDLEFIINKQKEMLFTSYKTGKSLLFYYLYGTVNYANAVLTKLLTNRVDILDIQDICYQAKEKWSQTIDVIKLVILSSGIENFDTSHFNFVARDEMLWGKSLKNRALSIETDSSTFRKNIEYLISKRFPFLTLQSDISDTKPDYQVRYFKDKNSARIKSPKIASRGTILIKELSSLEELSKSINNDITMMPLFFGRNQTLNNEYFMANTALRALMNEHSCHLILPKHIILNSKDINSQSPIQIGKNVSIIDFSNYILLCDSRQKAINIMGTGGSRGKVVVQSLKNEDLVLRRVDNEELTRLQRLIRSFTREKQLT